MTYAYVLISVVSWCSGYKLRHEAATSYWVKTRSRSVVDGPNGVEARSQSLGVALVMASCLDEAIMGQIPLMAQVDSLAKL